MIESESSNLVICYFLIVKPFACSPDCLLLFYSFSSFFRGIDIDNRDPRDGDPYSARVIPDVSGISVS